MKRRAIGILTFVFVLLLLVGACAPQPAPEVKPTPTPTIATPVPKVAVPVPPAPTEWDRLVELAKKEGAVAVYSSTIPLPARIPVMEAFKREYGIKVEYVFGRGADIGEKVLTEQRAKAYTADVFECGTLTPLSLLKPPGALGPTVKDLPAAKEDVWRVNPLVPDPEGDVFQWYSYGYGPAINTSLVKPQDEPRSWSDLLDPKWRGKILMDDPSIPGLGTYSFTLVKNYVGGVEYWQKMVEQKPKILRDARMEVEMLVRGEYPLLIGAWSIYLISALEAGAPLKLPRMKEGTYSASRAISLVRTAPHPNAAKLFVNWFLSKEGQTVISKASKQPSDRKDVSQEWVHPQFSWDPELKIIVFTREDFLGMGKDMTLSAEVLKIVR